jgi:hypothetical protein
MEILVNISSDKKDLVKAGNAVTGFKDCIGNVIKMTGAIIYTKEEENDKGVMETKTVTAIKDDKGEFITSISPTIKNSLEMITNTYDEDEIKTGIDVIIKSKKSNGGRDFLYIDLA